MATNRNGFSDLLALATELQNSVAKYAKLLPKLETACRALVTASETSDVQLARQLLAEALEAAKAGLAEMDRPDAAENTRVLETAAD